MTGTEEKGAGGVGTTSGGQGGGEQFVVDI